MPQETESMMMFKGQGHGPGSPWLVDVDVYLTSVNPVSFHLETCLPMAPDGNITFKNRNRPGFEIRYNLIDETGDGYRFPPQSKRADALWSIEGQNCPPANYGQQWPQFTTVRVVEPDCLTLVVRNKNETVTTFGYTLRVTKDGGLNYVDLDPGGTNDNGSYHS
jgi:hypothetical protein